MHHTSERRDQSMDRAIRLFQYLKELSELRTRVVRTVDSYESVLWLADVPHEPGCYAASWFQADAEDGDERWLSIGKPLPVIPAPEIPRELQPWVAPSPPAYSSALEPQLRTEIETSRPDTDPTDDSDWIGQEDPAGAPPVMTLLAEHPEISAQWEGYLERDWRPWAAEDQRRRRIQEVYAELFSIYQRQQRLGEQYEVVLGLGLLGWKTPAGNTVRRHLLTAQTGIGFDPVSGVITVGPAGEGAQLALEQDMLEATERPDLSEQVIIDEQQQLLDGALWQEAPLRALFGAWVHAVSAHGHYDDRDDPNLPISADPQVRLAPALILRKRTERSLIRMFGDIIERLEGGEPLPPGVRRLVDVVDDASFGEQFGGDGGPDGDGEVYFPLPANDEQRDIVGRLGSRQGVLVQGPPGTGKSHTIANLVCHLLATGQRVLVTSHTPRALKVLRDKIPAEVRPLCVSLLGDDRVALTNLEDSVNGITDRHYLWSERQARADIARLTSDLDRARRAEAETLGKMLRLRESETLSQPLPVAGYAGTAEGVARRLVEEEPQFAWIGVRPAVGTRAPLSNDEAGRLLSGLRRLSAARAAEVRRPRIALVRVPSPEQFQELVEREATALHHAAADRDLAGAVVTRLAAIDGATRDALRARLAELLRAAVTLQGHAEPWVGTALAQVFAGRELTLRQLLAETASGRARVEAAFAAAGDPVVRGLEGRDERVALTDATDLAAHLQSGGKWGFGPLRPEVVKRAAYLADSVTIDGRKCNDPEALRRLTQWLALQEGLRALHRQWEAFTPAPAAPASLQMAAYREMQATLEQVLAVAGLLAGARAALANAPGLLEPPPVHDSISTRQLLAEIDAAGRAAEAQAASAVFASLSRLLADACGRANAHEAVALLAAGVERRDLVTYGAAYTVLAELERDQIELAERDLLAQRLEAAAPALLEQLRATVDDDAWDDRLASFDAAWDWARADAYVAGRRDIRAYQDLVRDLAQTRDAINNTMGRLVATRAWSFCFERMTEDERQNLMAWMKTVRKIGKGSGKYVEQHRRAAREYMDKCRSAIPAWIMPIYRVAETVRPGADVFDVVIVDEASQSGPEALFLQYIARQIVVVGDDQQISPESVGINREEVLALQARHIPDLHFRENLGVDDSFFDQAVIRFGGRIRLREHFRCMPEIIQFSNNLSYQSEPLYPLRQYGADRLDPIKVVYVPTGYRQGVSSQTVNPAEAQALVDQIMACHDDPRYDGMSFGVISLQGGAQAKRIERLLLDQLGPEAFEERQLVCGDAYAFQGDERDVIFMSLVAAAGETRFRALTGAADTRRFNVAASRARDQVWLFHSVEMADLNPDCLRYKLLNYYLNPTGDEDPAQHGVFDSPFEEAVYQRILDRGYRVRPQVAVAGYRIDRVVEGRRGRLAVECDGERWHGPEQYQTDMDRQRRLERCGWTFWRVRGGDFYRNPEAALEELWVTLANLGIHPAGVEPDVALPDPPAPESRRDAGPEDWWGVELDDEAEPISTLDEPAAFGAVDLDWVIAEAEVLADPDPFAMFPAAPGSSPPIAEQPVIPAAPPPVTEPVFIEDEVLFAPYVSWPLRPLPHPLDVDEREVMRALTEIIQAEGPMPCHRAYRVYARGAGLATIDAATRSVLNRAMFRGAAERQWTERNETGEPGQMHKIVRMAGSPAVRVRERGDRLLQEIPPSEIAQALRLLAQDTGLAVHEHAARLYEELLEAYGLDPAEAPELSQRCLDKALAFLDRVSKQTATAQQSLF